MLLALALLNVFHARNKTPAGAGLRDPHTSPSGPAKRGGARTARHGRARNRAEHSRGYRSRTANANTHDVVAAAAASRAASLMSSAACHSIAVCARQQWARGGAPTPHGNGI